ncbi:MAG: chromosomal replication initiator protein DnaA [Chloroflexi bacterium HGW-Chloroflexi-8]|nr:MAG: chromosomal replication initiator protein DnaA [Chloroflexi bacterium HGW-Chloroflexi-8]
MNGHQAWQSLISQLQLEMSKATFDTWVKSSELIKYENQTFTIGVQNAYARDWLDSRLSSTVNRILTGMMNETVSVEFIVWHKDQAVIEPEETSASYTYSIAAANDSNSVSTQINTRYSFNNFVVGASNRLAHAACMAVAENPARSYNPLFLYGGVGLGKTHLLHAIGNTAQNSGLRVLYVSSEEFTNDLINAIRSHNTQAFRERYRSMDVLLIDDIQFISGKESTQEEFFHTFNTLHGQDKQLVISSDRPPKAMNTLEERLRSRFEWGLTVDIQPPDLETRTAILRSKAERTGRQVPNDILDSIARQIQSNIRELEGALTRVLAYSDLIGQPLSLQLVNVALADLLPKRDKIETTQVLYAVAATFGVDAKELLGKDRSREIALPRQVAMYLMREEANFSLPQIGAALGGRDHTTIMYGCDKIADLIERDDRLRRQLIQIREQLYGRQRVTV